MGAAAPLKTVRATAVASGSLALALTLLVHLQCCPGPGPEPEMEPEPERRIIRAPGSRAPHHFSGRRLRQRGEFFALLEPRYLPLQWYGFSMVGVSGGLAMDATQVLPFLGQLHLRDRRARVNPPLGRGLVVELRIWRV